MPAFTTLGAVEREEDLTTSLARLAEAGPAWFTATGYVSDVALRVPSPEGFVQRHFSGSYALVQLGGVSTGPFFVTIARAHADTNESWSGELVQATSLGVYVAAHAARLAEHAAPSPLYAAPAVVAAPAALQPIAGPAVAPQPVAVQLVAPASAPATTSAFNANGAAMARPVVAAAAPPRPAWAMAAAASASTRAAGESDEPELPQVGDLVDHFAFGRCEVVMSDGDRLRIRDVKPPGRVREVSVEMLRVMAPSDQDGKRLFGLARRMPS